MDDNNQIEQTTTEQDNPAQQSEQTGENRQTFAQDMYNQQVYNGQMNVQYVPAEDSNNKKAKKPLGKKGITAIICGGIALIALIIVGIIFIPKLLKSDREVVLDAFEATFMDGGATSFEEITGYKDMLELYKEQGGKYDVALSVYESGKGDNPYKIQLSNSKDNVNKKLYTAVEEYYKDNLIGTQELFVNDDTAYVNLPDMFDGYFKFTKYDNADQVLGLILGKETGEGTVHVDIENAETSDGSEKSEEINSGYMDAIENVWDNAEFDKVGREKITINGETVKTKKYRVTLSEEDIETAFNSIIDGLDEQLNDASTDSTGFSGNGTSEYANLIAQARLFLPMIIWGDFDLDVYIHDGKIVRIATDDSANIYGVVIEYDFCYDLYDGYQSSLINVTINGSSIDFDYEYNETERENGADFTYHAGMQIDSEQIASVSLEGSYNSLEKGKSCEINLDSIQVNLIDEEMINMAASYVIDAGKPEVKELDSSRKVYDLGSMSNEDMAEITASNRERIEKWLEELSKNGGEVYEMVYETIEEWIDSLIGDHSDDAADAQEVFSEDEMTLTGAGGNVKIVSCIDGFELFMACPEYIDYISDNYSGIEYVLESPDVNGEEWIQSDVSFNCADEENIVDESYGEEVTIDGVTCVYHSAEYMSLDVNVNVFWIQKPLETGDVLVIRGCIYDDEFDMSDIMKALESNHYEIVEQ